MRNLHQLSYWISSTILLLSSYDFLSTNAFTVPNKTEKNIAKSEIRTLQTWRPKSNPNIKLNNFFKDPVPAVIKDTLSIVKVNEYEKEKFGFFSQILSPPQYPGVPRPLWVVIAASIPTGLIWYGYYKFCIEEELMEIELDQKIEPRGFGGFGTLGVFTYGVLLGPLAEFLHLPGGMNWSLLGITFIYYTQFTLYDRVNEFYAQLEKSQGVDNDKPPLTIGWAWPIFFPLNLIVGLRQVHFLSEYMYNQRGIRNPPSDPVVDFFPFIKERNLSFTDLLLKKRLWCALLQDVEDSKIADLPSWIQEFLPADAEEEAKILEEKILAAKEVEKVRIAAEEKAEEERMAAENEGKKFLLAAAAKIVEKQAEEARIVEEKLLEKGVEEAKIAAGKKEIDKTRLAVEESNIAEEKKQSKIAEEEELRLVAVTKAQENIMAEEKRAEEKKNRLAEEARIAEEKIEISAEKEKTKIAEEKTPAEKERIAAQKKAEEERMAAEKEAKDAIIADEKCVTAEKEAKEKFVASAAKIAQKQAEEAQLVEKKKLAKYIEEARIAAEKEQIDKTRLAVEEAKVAEEKKQTKIAEEKELRLVAVKKAQENIIAQEKRAEEKKNRLAEEAKIAEEKIVISAEKEKTKIAEEKNRMVAERKAQENIIAVEKRAEEEKEAGKNQSEEITVEKIQLSAVEDKTNISEKKEVDEPKIVKKKTEKDRILAMELKQELSAVLGDKTKSKTKATKAKQRSTGKGFKKE